MDAEIKNYQTLKDFWPFYLSEHASRTNRKLHFIGSAIALVFFTFALITLNWCYLLYALFSGYGFAWVGHFLIEKNRPATFKYPFKSFISDWRMFYYILSFQIDKELEKYSIKNSR